MRAKSFELEYFVEWGAEAFNNLPEPRIILVDSEGSLYESFLDFTSQKGFATISVSRMSEDASGSPQNLQILGWL